MRLPCGNIAGFVRPWWGNAERNLDCTTYEGKSNRYRNKKPYYLGSP